MFLRAEMLVPPSPTPTNKEKTMTGAVALWLVVAGIALMVGGKKTMGAVVNAPLKWGGKLLGDALKAIVEFILDLLGKALRALGRLLLRGARRLFGLPPPPPPRREARRRPRHEVEEDEEDDD